MRSLSFYIYSLYHYLLQHTWGYPRVEPDLEAPQVDLGQIKAILSRLEPRERIVGLEPPEGRHYPPQQTAEGERRWEPVSFIDDIQDGKRVRKVLWGWWFYPNSRTAARLGGISTETGGT